MLLQTYLLGILCASSTFRVEEVAPLSTLKSFTPTPLKNEVLMLSLDTLDATSEKCIGLALHADIERQTSGRLRVFRRSKTLKEITEQDRSGVASAAEQTIVGYRSKLKNYPRVPASRLPVFVLREEIEKRRAENQVTADMSAVRAMELMPAAKLLAEILKDFPQADWGLCRAGVNTTFSLDPVGNELRLRTPLQKLLSQYSKDQEDCFDQFQKADTFSKEEIKKYGWIFPKPSGVASKRNVLLTVGRARGEAVFSLQVFDGAGKLESTASLSPKPFTGLALVDSKPSTSQKESIITPISMRSRKLLGIIGPDSRYERLFLGSTVDLAKDWNLFDPLLNEPLSFYVKDAIEGLARAKGLRNVVACLPDSLFDFARLSFVSGGVDVTEFETKVLGLADCEELVVDNTLIIRPRFALSEEAQRVSRLPLSRLLNAARKAPVELRELANYHTAYVDSLGWNPIVSRYDGTKSRIFGTERFTAEDLPHAFLAVLGDLEPEEWLKLNTNQRLKVDWSAHSAILTQVIEMPWFWKMESDLTDQEKTSGKLVQRVAKEGGAISLQSSVSTVVKRITMGESEQIAYVDTGNGFQKQTTRGTNLPYDTAWLTVTRLLEELPFTTIPDKLELLEKKYKLLWAKRNSLTAGMSLGNAMTMGSFSLHVDLEGTKTPVPWKDVPGFEIPK